MFGWGRKKTDGDEAPKRKPLDENSRRVHVRFVGEVQGVGFRWTSRQIAAGLGLTGWVKNESDGSVTLELQGNSEDVAAFFTKLVQSYQRYPIHYTIDSKEDIPLDPSENDFSVQFY
ncbi:MAG: acylphosphatase [Tractidigestivibacter sp.]|jgi:acylphosphatase|uniref:acylphosphatase n=1 Tax=Tractidigestivibacter sp. TaxID=2847320 RepID=UPI003D8EC2D0